MRNDMEHFCHYPGSGNIYKIVSNSRNEKLIVTAWFGSIRIFDIDEESVWSIAPPSPVCLHSRRA